MDNLHTKRSRRASDKTTGPEPAVAEHGGRSPASGDWLSTPTRELARRSSGADEVLLLWHPESDRVELSVRDLATGVSFHLEVAPGDALDAFHHPYAHAARRTRASPGAGDRVSARE